MSTATTLRPMAATGTVYAPMLLPMSETIGTLEADMMTDHLPRNTAPGWRVMASSTLLTSSTSQPPDAMPRDTNWSSERFLMQYVAVTEQVGKFRLYDLLYIEQIYHLKIRELGLGDNL